MYEIKECSLLLAFALDFSSWSILMLLQSTNALCQQQQQNSMWFRFDQQQRYKHTHNECIKKIEGALPCL